MGHWDSTRGRQGSGARIRSKKMLSVRTWMVTEVLAFALALATRELL